METRKQIAKRDNRLTEDLIKAILASEDLDDTWDLVQVLHCRGSKTEFAAALALCRSKKVKERVVGADILGQLGAADHTFLKESVDVLIELLSDKSDDVVSAVVVALGHRGEKRAAKHIIKLKNYPDCDIRENLAFALGLVSDDSPDVIKTLIELSTDKNDDVRNWAVFGLGTQSDKDSSEIRQALVNRLEEEDSEIRGEALVGLAKRKYPEIDKFIIKEFHCEFVSELSLEAAELFANPKLYPELMKLGDFEDVDDDDFIEQLRKAREACKPSSAPSEAGANKLDNPDLRS